MIPKALPLFLAAIAGAAACGCLSGVDPEARVDIVAPSADSFPPVGLYLGHRCGSLDCHGSTSRNLRLYGREGLRLNPMDAPGSGPTTAEELEMDYRSVVGLEPEVMSAVVKDHGKDPERLSLIRKARGEEDHAGGTLVFVGDDQDLCLISWLRGAVDMTACTNALKVP